MRLRIQQLPPIIANQIAAGEVIERPASVVKELLENALDANAESISIDIGYGGLNHIKISDNGTGIIAEDLPLAIAAHATSKISTLNDLYAIHSMGFRGEALASIASVAKVVISSKPKEQEHAMNLSTQNGEYNILPCARTIGTTVEVNDLFYNAPVRKRFLKSEKIEFQAIETVVKRFAMGAPHIALSLKHNGKMVMSLPANVNEQGKQLRLNKLFGSAFMREAIYLDVDRAGMRLMGWISNIQHQRSQNDRIWVYINQRMVKDKLIFHAIKQAYDGLLHPGRFPVCLLYLTINPSEVDVNVHPTKHEVRFQQPRLVHDFFTTQIKDVLVVGEIESSYKPITVQYPLEVRETNRPFIPELKSAVSADQSYANSIWHFLNNQYVLTFIEQQPVLLDIEKLYQQYLSEQLIRTSSLARRPLLVPVTFPLSVGFPKDALVEELSHLGLAVEISEQDIKIREVPIIIPHLDLRLFFERLADLEVYTRETLQTLICQTQVLDSRLLSQEERQALNEWLVQNKPNHGYIVLTVEHCRMLMHA